MDLATHLVYMQTLLFFFETHNKWYNGLFHTILNHGFHMILTLFFVPSARGAKSSHDEGTWNKNRFSNLHMMNENRKYVR